MLRHTLAAVAVAISGAASVQAQSCDEPSFAHHRTSNGLVRAAYNALEDGDLAVAIHFSSEAAEARIAPSQRGAGYTNLCAAYARDGQIEAALPACDRAVELRDESWIAYTNRGAAKWLAGDYAAARADFTRAAELESGEDAVLANTALSQCAIG